MWRDIRFAFRLFAASPGLSALAVISLAIAIAANTTIFSVVYTLLLAPPVFRDTGRLVVIWESNKVKGITRTPVAPATVRDWKDSSGVFQGLELVAPGSPVTISSSSLPERANIQYATPGLFELLGVTPAAGTFFAKADENNTAAPVLIGYSYWQRHYGGNPSAIGQKIVVNQQARLILGVLPRDFHLFDMDTDIWMPIGFPDTHSRDRSFRVWLMAVGKLKSGETVASAQVRLDVLSAAIARAHPDTSKDWGALVQPIQEAQFGNWKNILYPLWGMVVLLLLIACANVANLFLGRLSARAREISLRASLGATRRRLILQLVNEGVAIGLLGGALGLLLTVWGIRLFAALAPSYFPLIHAIHLSASVLLFCLAGSLASGILLAIVPAVISTRVSLNTALKSGMKTSARGWFRGAFAVLQIALTLVLLLGTGLMIRSFLRVLSIDPGFHGEHVVTMQIFLSGPRYFSQQPDGVHIQDAAGNFYSRLLEQASALPGVQSAGIVSWLPQMGYNTGRRERGFQIPGQSGSRTANFNAIGGEYFDTLRIPLLEGRAFERTDGWNGPWVAIVNRAFAARYWPGQSPIGKLLVTEEGRGATTRQIIGVVADIREDTLERKPEPEIFVPYWQQPRIVAGHGYQNRVHMVVVVRVAGDPDATVAAIRKIAAAIDPNQPVYGVRTMSAVLEEATALRRLHTVLMEIFSSVALFLSAIGIYSVSSRSVTERTSEIGLRIAVGADRWCVYRLFLLQGGKLILIGLAIGLTLGFAFHRVLSSFLFDTSVYDALTLVTVCGLFVCVCVTAIWIPARRAVHVDPMTALRYE